MDRKESGQALVELVLSVPVLALAISGTFWLLRSTALRIECSRVVFEAVHAEVHGRAKVGTGIGARSGVLLRRNSKGVEGWKKCGTRTERLFLPHLGMRKPGA